MHLQSVEWGPNNESNLNHILFCVFSFAEFNANRVHGIRVYHILSKGRVSYFPLFKYLFVYLTTLTSCTQTDVLKTVNQQNNQNAELKTVMALLLRHLL